CLNNYEQAHLFLKEAIDLNPKRSVAYFICGEIFFRQNKYVEAVDNLNKAINYKAKLNNLYILLGNSCFFTSIYYDYYDDYTEDIKNYNIALKNDPNNYLCLKNGVYAYERKGDYSNTLNLLDKLLNINKEDSLVLCYYGEILYNMTQYRKAISYFTKAYTIDPENIHNLNRRAITYYIIKEYDKVLSDLDKIIQLDPLNSSAYYLKCLTYYTKNDNNKAKVSFKKYAKLLNSDNNLANIQLFHLEYLLNKNSSKDLNDILTKIDQIHYENDFLRFIKCKIYIELKEYSKANPLLNHIGFTFFGYFIQAHPDFWSYLYEVCEINKNDFTKFGIVDEFSKYMYKKHEVYFVSNLTNLNNELCQFQESDISR
ncbi:TPR-like protein, partial [Rhizophagus irregularis]